MRNGKVGYSITRKSAGSVPHPPSTCNAPPTPPATQPTNQKTNRHDRSQYFLVEIITLTCVSGVVSNGNDFIFVLLGVHSEVVVLGITSLQVVIDQFNAQTLTPVRRQQINIIVT